MIILFQYILFSKEFIACNNPFCWLTKDKKRSGTSFWCTFSTWFFHIKIPNKISGVNTENKSTHRVQTNCALHLFFLLLLLLLRSHYVADLIKKLEFHLMVSSVLLKNKFRHAKIIALKIGILMSETACINPLMCY